jgi:V8-like Glu-specific endopeptidase
VRPSPGAETRERPNAPTLFNALEPADLAAPGDGRTPVLSARHLCLLALSAALWLAPTSPALADANPSRWVDAPHTSGTHDNTGVETNLVWSISLHEPDATWLRVQFGDCQLGAGSYLRITSVTTQLSHRLNATSLGHWSHFCGPLKGDTVWVELFVAPGDAGVRASVTRLMAGVRPEPGFTAATLCDGDSRVPTRDDRVGRMFNGGGCTGWLLSNGAVCSAGHCVDTGPGNFFSVNVQPSDPDGTVNPALPNDMFPIDSSNVLWQDSGGWGGDWGIYALFPNSNTGERAHVGRGFFRPSQIVPVLNTSLRITGYGNDNTPAGATNGNNSRHRTEQTSTGPYFGQINGVGGNIYHTYRTDTEPANSGSPIILRLGAVDFSLGIHTDGGCADDGEGSNKGTSFNQANLANALNTYPPGGGERYLDTASSTATQSGTIFQPFRNFAAAYNSAPDGGQVIMVAGGYPRTTTGNAGTFGSGQTKSVTLRAPVGAVTIGQ